MALIQNEQTKLLAGALDRASTACFTVGIITPMAGYLYNVSDFRGSVSVIALILGMVGWLGSAVALHFLARAALKGLKE